MLRIPVNTSRGYDVLLDAGSLSGLGRWVSAVSAPCTAALISDDTVYALYGGRAESALRSAGFSVVSFVFPHGEAQKTLTTLGAVLNFLCAGRLTRSDLVVALGGGVVGDVAGFAAGVYQRGIRYVQVPTTLLAMVDSSVGGKTAVDLDGGKNQAGVFWQPSLVVCDTDTLSTLPEAQYRCGCAEVIKYGLLGDASLFRTMGETPVSRQYAAVIARCIEMKRNLVQADEFDRGERQKLNLGHTFGHAIEAVSGFAVPHGDAVAMGMAIVTRAAAAKGYCSAETAQKTAALLRQYGLPTQTGCRRDALVRAVRSDKKRAGDFLRLVVPERIGVCRVETICADSVSDWLCAGGVP